MSILQVPDEVVISFFTAAIVGMAGVITVLWKRLMEMERDRDKKQLKDEDDSQK